MSLAERVRTAISIALDSMVSRGELIGGVAEGSSWVLERPKRADHGDLATNVAMARVNRPARSPRSSPERSLAAMWSQAPKSPVRGS
jgi:arginyl-tRNA synthetase